MQCWHCWYSAADSGQQVPLIPYSFLGEIIYLALIECDADDNSKGHSGLTTVEIMEYTFALLAATAWSAEVPQWNALREPPDQGRTCSSMAYSRVRRSILPTT